MALVLEIEALNGCLLSQDVDPIEPPKHFLDARERGRGDTGRTVATHQLALSARSGPSREGAMLVESSETASILMRTT
jgi:hypothetical protein